MVPVVYRFDEFELDLAAHELRHRGQAQAVEPQVFSVLALLVSRAGSLVAKDELLMQVWGDAFVSEATLSSRIMAARKAIGDSGTAQRWIKTLHGKGFRFDGEVEAWPAGEVGPLPLARHRLEQAEAALGAAKVAEAERALASASQALERVDSGEADREWALWHSVRARALILREGWSSDRAPEHFEEAIRLAEGVAAVDVFRSARYHLATLYEIRGDFALSETLMRAAIAHLDGERTDPEARELLTCSLFHQGRFEEAAMQAQKGVETALASEGVRLSAYYGEDPQVSCLYWLALASLFMGRDEEAKRIAGRALRLSEQPGHVFCLAHSRQQSAMFGQVSGDIDLCEHWANATIAIGERQGLSYRTACGRILLEWAKAVRGKTSIAPPEMTRSLQQIQESGAGMEAPYFETLIAEAECLAGNPDGASARLDAILDSATVRRGYFFTPEIYRQRALAEARRKAGADPVPWLQKGMDEAAKTGARYLEARLRADFDKLTT